MENKGQLSLKEQVEKVKRNEHITNKDIGVSQSSNNNGTCIMTAERNVYQFTLQDGKKAKSE